MCYNNNDDDDDDDTTTTTNNTNINNNNINTNLQASGGKMRQSQQCAANEWAANALELVNLLVVEIEVREVVVLPPDRVIEDARVLGHTFRGD